MFAPVLLEVPGQMTRCPCGFGAYGFVDRVAVKQWAIFQHLGLINIGGDLVQVLGAGSAR